MPPSLNFPQAVPKLTGQSVCLRELTEADIPAWFHRATDPVSADLAGDPIPDSIEMGTTWLQRHRDRFRERAAIRWAIEVESASESVGTVGLTITSNEHRVAEFAIVIAGAYWGKGIGTAAVALVQDYAFGTLGLVELQAEVLQRNIASIRLLEGAGFQLVRTVREDSRSDGSEDCFLYALRNPAE